MTDEERQIILERWQRVNVWYDQVDDHASFEWRPTPPRSSWVLNVVLVPFGWSPYFDPLIGTVLRRNIDGGSIRCDAKCVYQMATMKRDGFYFLDDIIK